MKKKITVDEAIKIVSAYACPGDYGMRSWAGVRRAALNNCDGVAAALEIDDEYEIIYRV